MSNYQPMTTGYSRVFLIENRAGPRNRPSYHSCLAAQGIDQAFGDVEKIECPDPYRYGQWEEVGTIQGQVSRATVDLVGRYALDLASDVLRLARKRCALDVQLHLGSCKDPTEFTDFDKAVILENAYLTNWSTNELGALGSDGNAAVDETVSVSAKDVYEVLQLSASEKAASIVVNVVRAVAVCGSTQCGDCGDTYDSCDHIYAVTESGAGGSPALTADIVFSVDGGDNFYADDIDTLAAGEDADGVACLGEYLVVVSQDVGSIHYALLDEVNDVGFDETWVEITTGFVAGHNPFAIWSVGSVAFIVGDTGYVYLLDNPPDGVVVLDAGVATIHQLNDVHALNESFAVAVGDNNAVIYTENQTTWAAAGGPVGFGIHLNCVWVKSEYCWFAGDNQGRLWYTEDKGAHWTQKQDFGASVEDIAFATASVGYVAVTTATPKGQIWRTYDGGYQWTVIPEGAGNNMPGNDAIYALGVCEDPNFVVGVGLSDTSATDGFIVIAKD